MAADVESARLDWEEAHDRFERERSDPARAEALDLQLDVVLRELRKRVGATFTLRELGLAYRGADVWVRDVVSQEATAQDWPRTLAVVEGAAFHVYSRGAMDYAP